MVLYYTWTAFHFHSQSDLTLWGQQYSKVTSHLHYVSGCFCQKEKWVVCSAEKGKWWLPKSSSMHNSRFPECLKTCGWGAWCEGFRLCASEPVGESGAPCTRRACLESRNLVLVVPTWAVFFSLLRPQFIFFKWEISMWFYPHRKRKVQQKESGAIGNARPLRCSIEVNTVRHQEK